MWQIWNFLKFTMADGRHTENRFWPTQQPIAQFQWNYAWVKSFFCRISAMKQSVSLSKFWNRYPRYTERISCFPNAVWASASGAFRIVSDTLVEISGNQSAIVSTALSCIISDIKRIFSCKFRWMTTLVVFLLKWFRSVCLSVCLFVFVCSVKNMTRICGTEPRWTIGCHANCLFTNIQRGPHIDSVQYRCTQTASVDVYVLYVPVSWTAAGRDRAPCRRCRAVVAATAGERQPHRPEPSHRAAASRSSTARRTCSRCATPRRRALATPPDRLSPRPPQTPTEWNINSY